MCNIKNIEKNNLSVPEPLQNIIIKNAKVNNLKNISLTIPRDKLVVITGLSGSGKSSLAFDTIYAEGQRRYIDCLSSYARQFIGNLKKPDVDLIEGLSPAISIEQKTLNHNPRSTVGTTTEIYDYLRLLYAKIGIQYCVDCNVPVIKRTTEQIISDIHKHYTDRSILILSPLVFARKGNYNDLFTDLIAQGYSRVRINGVITRLHIDLSLPRYKNHTIELVIDKCIVNPDNYKRLEASVNLAIKRSSGTLIIIDDTNNTVADNSITNTEDIQIFSINYSCPKCNKAYLKLAPNMFSFNSNYGLCPKCKGLGSIESFDEKLLIPNKQLAVINGGINILGIEKQSWLWSKVKKFAEDYNIPLDISIADLDIEKYNLFMYGNPNETRKNVYNGFIPYLNNLYNDAFSTAQQKELNKYRSTNTCYECNGSRLRKESVFVRINNLSIDDVVRMDIESCFNYFSEISSHLNNYENQIATLLLKEIRNRLKFLLDVGLPYFSLNRTIMSLSGGEAQRIRLASQIGSQLVGITYVLDEPSIGLHQHDNNKLINSLKQLRDLGNSVIIVEHDRTMIEQSDFIVDVGPGAGTHGGKILIAEETNNLSKLPAKIKKESLTYQYIKNKKQIFGLNQQRKPDFEKAITLTGATGNNLKNLTLKIPLGMFVCITGMSGAGKSSLINDTLFPILSNRLQHSSLEVLKYNSIEGIEFIDKVIEINQNPIGRTPRSNPATYTKLFDIIRTHYSTLNESLVRGYKPGRFSFNVPGGRCEECEGAGIKKLAMNFLPDVYVTCEACNGKRYNEETLQVKFKNKSIADVLDMTVEEANIFFKSIPKLNNRFQVLNDVGLGYIKLGQQAPTLSGGEAQRVKLATELARPSTGKTLFLLDEPTTGLHFEDIRILLNLLQKLVDKGNTIIVIEHNLDIIKCADWIIDLGPEGGNKGGYIVAEGTPNQIIENKNSITGKYLKEEIKNINN